MSRKLNKSNTGGGAEPNRKQPPTGAEPNRKQLEQEVKEVQHWQGAEPKDKSGQSFYFFIFLSSPKQVSVYLRLSPV